MRRYETIFIVDPDLSDEERSPLFERLKPLFPQLDGFLVMVEEWGTKNLAYEIKKKKRGYYVRLDYCGTGPLVNEIERFFRIDDRILKYMTVLLEEDVDLESLQAELAKAETEKDQPDQTEEADTEQKTVEVMEADTEQKTVEVVEADTEQKPVEVVEPDMENSETIQTESNKEEL
jgi:small subunit ribosomal protein S6